MYRYKNLYFRFSAGTCTSTFVTANIFPWYLLIRENFANEAVPVLKHSTVPAVSTVLCCGCNDFQAYDESSREV